MLSEMSHTYRKGKATQKGLSLRNRMTYGAAGRFGQEEVYVIIECKIIKLGRQNFPPLNKKYHGHVALGHSSFTFNASRS